MRKERRMKRGIEPACVIAAVCLVLSLRQPDFGHTGLFPGCGIRGHLLFQFFHASAIHAALNCYCFILTVYRFKLSAFRVAMALCVAAIFPISFLPAPAFPTVGLSGAVYFLFGSLSFAVARKLYWQGWMIVYLTVGLLMPQTNGFLHLWCYLLGAAFAFFEKKFKAWV
nr:MAG TPA: Rhomboid protease GlpG [Caudoviricetes sp.]